LGYITIIISFFFLLIYFSFIYYSTQVAIQILNLLLIFLLFFSTYLFQVGLISEVIREFRAILYVMLLYLVVYGIYAGVKLSLFAGQGIKQDNLWNETSFLALSIIQKITALGYYGMLLSTTLRLGETKWYQRGPWVAKYANLAVTARRNLSEQK